LKVSYETRSGWSGRFIQNVRRNHLQRAGGVLLFYSYIITLLDVLLHPEQGMKPASFYLQT